jgi:hypothetical protein
MKDRIPLFILLFYITFRHTVPPRSWQRPTLDAILYFLNGFKLVEVGAFSRPLTNSPGNTFTRTLR